ncbi:hypothetical protein [Glycomyces arizonensis]|uniref:hypothetical protein n=1 Tax=Glycomyces arizonensis TaxID=256035 RepID=UPI000427582C|nr:hypothetical protein [Glycomyces arizonensis]
MADQFLGEFKRSPATFFVHQTAPGAYRIDFRDNGGGPSEVCAFTTEAAPRWRGAWNGDQWCAWIEAEARSIIGRTG